VDPFVTKLSQDGSSLVYSTFVGPESGIAAAPEDIVVDTLGNAYLVGLTNASDFPTTPGAHDRTFGGGIGYDVFVSKLNPAGSALLYSTFIGAGAFDHPYAAAVDGLGHVYVAGRTSDVAADAYPTTPGAFDRTRDGSGDAFVTKLRPDGTGLVYSTYLGGTNDEGAFGVALDGSGDAHVIGTTFSSDFPTTADAFDSSLGRDGDAFYIKLNASGSNPEYATYFGGPGLDGGIYIGDGGAIAVDPRGDVYLTGATQGGVATTPGAFDTSWNLDYDAFVAKFSFGAGPPSSVELRPETATNLVDERHCVAATVRDASGNPTPDVIVRFSISGSVTADASDTTDGDGVAPFCYQGPEIPGSDAITAFADTDADGDQDAGEPAGTAAKNWVLPSAGESCRATAGGNITAANGDRAHIAGTVRAQDGASRGNPRYRDLGPDQPFFARSVEVAVVVCERGSVTAFGKAVIGRSEAPLDYRIEMRDGRPHARDDAYRILLANGYDSGLQPLDTGSIRIR
jgi:hypothetical protein